MSVSIIFIGGGVQISYAGGGGGGANVLESSMVLKHLLVPVSIRRVKVVVQILWCAAKARKV